jgi:Excalibur calcium-binding domain
MKKLIGAVGCALTAVALSAAVLGLAPTASASGPYANCTQAHADGRYDIPQGDPDYWPAGDRDHDGIACES